MSKYKESLETIQTIVKDPAAFRGGVPQWKSSDEIDQYFTRKGYRLTGGDAWGPKDQPDGRQLIYEGPNNVIVKVKTRGYGEGGPERRRGVATMSIEATDGKVVTSIEKGARAGVEKGATWVLKNAPEWGGNARCSFLRVGL